MCGRNCIKLGAHEMPHFRSTFQNLVQISGVLFLTQRISSTCIFFVSFFKTKDFPFNMQCLTIKLYKLYAYLYKLYPYIDNRFVGKVRWPQKFKYITKKSKEVITIDVYPTKNGMVCVCMMSQKALRFHIALEHPRTFYFQHRRYRHRRYRRHCTSTKRYLY